MREITTEKRLLCPICGYVMPIWITPGAEAHGVFVKCKGRNCQNLIEIKFKNGWQKV